MTIALHNGSSSGIYDRWGLLIGGGEDVLALLGGTATSRVLSGSSWVTRETNLYASYSASPVSPQSIDGIDGSITSWRSAQQQLLQAIQTRMQNTCINMANADSALAQANITQALQLLTQQMTTAAATIRPCNVTFGALTSVGSPVGTPVVVLTAYRGDGLTWQGSVMGETLTFRCTGDSGGSATAGNEPVSVVGQATYPAFDYRWPGGSGCNASLNCVDGSKNNSTGNLLFNSDFSSFVGSADVPDDWVLVVGTANTNITNGTTSNAYTPSGGSLEIKGDGATLVKIRQAFNTAATTVLGTGGTPAVLAPNTVYILNGWVKTSATPTAGTFTFSLTDANGTVLADVQGNNNSFTVNLTAGGLNVGTSFVNFSGVFRTPGNLTSVTTPLKLQIANTGSALDNAKNVFFGRLSLAKATSLYTGGVGCAIFSGATKLVNSAAPDTYTMSVSNSLGVFARELQRYLNLVTLNGTNNLPVIIPYAASQGAETVLDSYIL